jgi:type I restriction enzyme, R subunit
MTDVGKPERVTQNRVIELFKKELGYRYLGNWTERINNSNVEEEILHDWLTKRGNSEEQITRVLYSLTQAAKNPSGSVYQNNQEVYKLLRYGVNIKLAAGQNSETIQVIDWEHPDQNDFAIAEEVTLSGNHDRRPDLVLYVNGIALGVIELKRSNVSIGEGIRQNLSNQLDEFHPWFFSTIQYVFAGNDTEGLRYGTVKTTEKFFMTWKEDEADNTGTKLDKYLLKMCQKSRFLEIIHDFVVFDGGVKKLPRPHQYFAVKAAQKKIAEGEGGIIWHTQGSGKSIVMVLLAKWLLENNSDVRVLVVTDRDELDKQIEKVFASVGEEMWRTRSGNELRNLIAATIPRLICSLVHKTGPGGNKDFDEYLKELLDSSVPSSGKFIVFVDEAHRSHSGKFHKALTSILPDAILIGFTGTPLLKDDADSRKVFGGYIHTYLMPEAVKDGVILDLAYEARDIDQHLSSPARVDDYFAEKTKGLNSWQQNELKKQWATLQKLFNSKDRLEKIVGDIELDFLKNERLKSGLGTAILVANSVYDACRYFKFFQDTPLRGKCGIVTSYDPHIKDIKTEETGEGESEKQFKYKVYTDLLAAEKLTTEAYEEKVKKLFIDEPANMRLLIVVDKLLTGFDAPSCSVIYIDKKMKDHGLFQAICRTNRLDDDSKVFGQIIDYKGLFKNVEGAMSVYSSELDEPLPDEPSDIIIQTRIDAAKERIADALDSLFHIIEPVEPPKSELQFQHYFCGNTEIPSDLENTSHRREALYRGVVALVRAIANISDSWDESGYSDEERKSILEKQDYYLTIRDLVRRTAGEELDLKPYEADMRRLIDMYVEADPSRRIFSTLDVGLLDILDKLGAAKTIEKIEEGLSTGSIADHEVAAEMIENNIRKKIVKSKFSDPVYYETMSDLLNQVIADRKAGAIEYEEYLKSIEEIAKKAKEGRLDSTPASLDTPGKRALWNNLGNDEKLALAINQAVLDNAPDSWRGNLQKEIAVKRAIAKALTNNGVTSNLGDEQVERIFSIIREQGEYA